jgi:hypothetical protein
MATAHIPLGLSNAGLYNYTRLKGLYRAER